MVSEGDGSSHKGYHRLRLLEQFTAYLGDFGQRSWEDGRYYGPIAWTYNETLELAGTTQVQIPPKRGVIVPEDEKPERKRMKCVPQSGELPIECLIKNCELEWKVKFLNVSTHRNGHASSSYLHASGDMFDHLLMCEMDGSSEHRSPHKVVSLCYLPTMQSEVFSN